MRSVEETSNIIGRNLFSFWHKIQTALTVQKKSYLDWAIKLSESP